MKRYRVLVTFSGWHTVYVDADSINEATRKVDIILDAGELEPDDTGYNEQEIFSVEEVE